MFKLQDLQDAFADYMNANASLLVIEDQNKQHTKSEPKPPKVVTCQEDIDRYAIACEEFQVTKATLDQQEKEARISRNTKQDAVKQMIPLDNCLFKLEFAGYFYGVSRFWDVWGGGHYEWTARPWSDELQPEKNRTEYN